jgi:transcriptional regulator with XRE-family HTH domain
MEAGYSLREFASRMGLSAGYVSRVETGKEAPPTVARIRKMAGLLSCDPDELFSVAGKVDPDLVRYICSVPAVVAFLRFARRRGLTCDEIEPLIAD